MPTQLPDPPLELTPGVAAYDVELLRAQVPAQTALGDSAAAVLKLRYLAAHDGPPEIAALAWPEQLPARRADARSDRPRRHPVG